MKGTYTKKRALFELHIAVFLFGFTAILGDLIKLSALNIVWWRVVITTISLVFLIRMRGIFKRYSRRLILIYVGIGILVGLHWVTFYGAIKLSNVSITLVCMAVASFFTAFLEPLIMRTKVKRRQILFGLAIIPAMYLVVREVNPSMWWGVPVGLLSAFLAALFATLNKRYINDAPILEITFLELGSAALFLSLVVPFQDFSLPNNFWPSTTDWVYLIVLALLCTTFAYVFSLRPLKVISAFTANLTINLEPVYGILLAAVLLNDHKELSGNFYIGVLVILVLVFSYPLMKKRNRVVDESN